MRRTPRRIVAVSAAAVLALGTLLVPAQPAQAANTVAFTPKYSTNANGAILTIGNNLLTCPAGSSSAGVSCASARGGSVADNNGFTMVNLDADGVDGTSNSSSSTLNLPAGSTVLWAGLYWGARLQAGTGGSAGNAAAVNSMLLQAPGGGYQTVTASAAARDQFGPNTTSYNAYQRFADVTSVVQAAGNGTYWGANVAAATGEDRYAGWAMTVVYAAPGLPLRNLTVFDGFNVVSGGNPQNITVSGFQAPLAGTVDAQLTMVAYEGDLSQTGDFTRLNNTQLATALSPGSNFFDSANGLNGASVTTRTPADRNQLGFDIKNLGVSGVIPNGATSAQFTFSSNGDVYYPGVVGLAINLYAPDFTTSSKSVVDLNGNSPARPGDTLRYTLTYTNTGQDNAVNVISRDLLPVNTTYVPGSLRLLSAPPGVTTGTLPDSYVQGGVVTVPLGTPGAVTPPTGGRIGIGQSSQYSVDVVVGTAAGGATVTNLANLAYSGETPPRVSATYTTNPASTDVITQADVSVTKSMAPAGGVHGDPSAVGSEIVGTITVTNNGPNTAMNVTMRDPIIDGWTNASLDVPTGVTCTVTNPQTGVVNCSLGNLEVGQSVVIRAHGSMDPATTQTSMTNLAYVSTDSYDPNLNNNVGVDTIALVRVADLAITKTATPASATPGTTVSYTLSVTNNGPSTAQDVVISDLADNAAQLALTQVTDTSGGATCAAPAGSSLQCTVSTMAPGATATVTVTGRIASNLGAIVAVGNAATVTANTADTNPANNRVTATVTTTAASADIRLTKSASPTPLVAGSQVTYTITATNFGPSDALGASINDLVPVGVTATSATSSRGACTIQQNTPSAGRQTVLCLVQTMNAPATAGQPGASVTITVNGTVDPAATGSIANTATSLPLTPDPNPGNSTATVTTPVTQAYDLSVSKQANRSALPAGSPEDPLPVTYTITVTNNGPSAATGVMVEDQIPTALDLVSVPSGCTAPNPISGDPDHELLTCTIAGPIAVGGTAAIQVPMQATSNLAAAEDPVTETVTIAAPGDTTPSNNTSTWTLSGEPYVDLSLSKTAPATVTAGQMMTYSFGITNNPIGDEPGVVALAPSITDALPAGVTLVPFGGSVGDVASVTPDYCTASGQDVTCTLPPGTGDLEQGENETVTISVLVAPDVQPSSTLVNIATVVNNPSNPDPAPANNTAQATTNVVAEADVAISGVAVTPETAGQTGPNSWWDVTFTLTNDGPSVARDVVFRVDIDVNAAVDPTGLPEGCDITRGELVCTITGADLAPGAGVDIDFRMLPPAYAAAGPHAVTANVSSSTPDANLGNNDDAAPFTIAAPLTHLDLTKTAVDTVPNPNGDGHDAYFAGRPFAFNVVVSVPNTFGSGIADAQNVTVVDAMPPGFIANLVSTTQGTCTVDDGGTGVSCDIGTIAGFPGGAPVTVTIYGFVDVSAEGEQFTNTATAASTTPDIADPGSPASATGGKSVDVAEQADLRLFKEPDAPTFNAGGQVGYTLTAVNTGPSDVEQATIVDTLPVGLTFDAADSPGCSVTGRTPETGQQVTCDNDGADYAIGVSGSVSVHLVATTDPRMDPQTVTNTATVSSGATDPDPTNNTATAVVSITRLADVAVTGSFSTLTPAAGGQVTISGASFNNGPSSSWVNTGDTVFPPGFIPVDWSVPFNTCTVSPAPPADPATVPWQDISYTLHCEPIDPTGPFDPGVAGITTVVLQIPGDTPTGDYTTTSAIRTQTPESDCLVGGAPTASAGLTVAELQADCSNNVVSGTVFVQHVSDTDITKTLVEPNPMLAGRPATWRLTVTNHGPSIADNVVISDVVPDGMSYVSAQMEGGEACPPPEVSSSTGEDTGDEQVIVRCPVDTIGVDESVSALVTFRLDADTAGQDLCNAALVGSGSLDPDADDNEAVACAEPVAPPPADLSVTVTANTPELTSGDQADLTAVVRNDGPGPATGVVVTFDIPDGLTDYSGVVVRYPDGTSRPADCVVGSLTCTIGDLEPGQEVEYRIAGTVAADPGAQLVVTGTVAQDWPDPVPGNDTASDVVVVLATSTSEPPATPPAEPSSSPQGPGLPMTGLEVLRLLALAAAMIAAGAGLVSRRQRPRHGR
jgi:uncharacterized repeat protein (TIGR01451 family)